MFSSREKCSSATQQLNTNTSFFKQDMALTCSKDVATTELCAELYALSKALDQYFPQMQFKPKEALIKEALLNIKRMQSNLNNTFKSACKESSDLTILQEDFASLSSRLTCLVNYSTQPSRDTLESLRANVLESVSTLSQQITSRGTHGISANNVLFEDGCDHATENMVYDGESDSEDELDDETIAQLRVVARC